MNASDASTYPDSDGYPGELLRPIVNLWSRVAGVLGVNLKQGAEFVEHAIQKRRIRLLSLNRLSGLWHPLQPEEARMALLALWSDAEDRSWDLSDLTQDSWKRVRLLPHDDDLIWQWSRARSRAVEQPTPTMGSESGRWPWGTYTTKRLEDLAAAAERWWVNFDPTDNFTAPTNDEVIAWLVANRKVPRRTAEIMASILRADGLPTGPRT